MASLSTSGLDELIDKLEKVGQGMNEPLIDAMLQAGAEEVKKAWKKTADKYDLRNNGDMIESIDYSQKPKSLGAAKYIDIYPQGTDRRGERNAEKAFLLHYGWSSFQGTHWVDEAEEIAEEPAIAAMEAVFDNLIKIE